jgi:hypothetical protein
MLAVRHFPNLATPALMDRLRERARYDVDGRASVWLFSGGVYLPADFKEIALAVCPDVPPEAWEGVALQCYRDGNAITPCHSDEGSTGLGFILSLGAARTLRTHRVAESGLPNPCGYSSQIDVCFIECVNGTAVIWDREFHRTHHHQIVADPGAGERLSLVFRTSKGG